MRKEMKMQSQLRTIRHEMRTIKEEQETGHVASKQDMETTVMMLLRFKVHQRMVML